jgi:hypothetical protein
MSEYPNTHSQGYAYLINLKGMSDAVMKDLENDIRI